MKYQVFGTEKMLFQLNLTLQLSVLQVKTVQLTTIFSRKILELECPDLLHIFIRFLKHSVSELPKENWVTYNKMTIMMRFRPGTIQLAPIRSLNFELDKNRKRAVQFPTSFVSKVLLNLDSNLSKKWIPRFVSSPTSLASYFNKAVIN